MSTRAELWVCVALSAAIGCALGYVVPALYNVPNMDYFYLFGGK